MDIKSATSSFKSGGLVSARLELVPQDGGEQYVMVITTAAGEEVTLGMGNFHAKGNTRYFKSANAGVSVAEKIGFSEINVKTKNR